MRERYFHMYESIKFKECFYAAHEVRANRLYRLFTSITLAISIISVLVWSVSKTVPALWAIIIAVAQFAQAYSVNLPYSGQLAALKYLMPELNQLLLCIDKSWQEIDVKGYDEEKILGLVSEYEGEFTDLQNRFTRGIQFPEISAVLKKAAEDQASYFSVRYTYSTEQRENVANVE